MTILYSYPLSYSKFTIPYYIDKVVDNLYYILTINFNKKLVVNYLLLITNYLLLSTNPLYLLPISSDQRNNTYFSNIGISTLLF